MFLCPPGTRRRVIVSLLMVLVAALLLQGCAAHSSTPVPPPVPADENPIPEKERATEAPLAQEESFDDEALSDEGAFFEDEGVSDGDDFFDDEGLIEEFEETPEKLVSDPLAPMNRAIFAFNDKLLTWVVKPVATGYRAVTPTVVRKGISNFFSNLKTPVRFVCSLLQGKLKGAGTELSRFVVNTTVGGLGFGDPAEAWLHLESTDEDLGQVLATWGVGNGPYLVLPFLGPSTLRDSIIYPGYFYLNPVGYIKPTELSLGITAIEKLNEASFMIGDYQTLKESALDPYTFFRDLYIQHRNMQISQ